jgi:hypothetical protein
VSSSWLRATSAALALGILSWSLAAGCGDDADSGTGGAGGSTGPGGGLGGGFASSSSTGGFDSCAEATVKGERIPVQMLIMFDKSQSMLLDQKWAGATAALTAFFQDEDSAGLSIALRFFPDDDPVAGCDDPACSVDACATPLVPIGTLNALPGHSDPQQQALVDAVASRSPSGQTPTYAALAGAEQWATENAADGVKTVVVLVTDGEPNGCPPEDTASIAQLASDARTNADVFTYTIGMDGANVAQLDDIAVAGGTGEAFVVGGNTIHNDLIAAFEAIGTAPIECSFPVPDAESAGQPVDPSLVNLSYDDGSGEEPVTIPQVPDADACGNDAGWYYDDPEIPTEIHLCPATCTLVQGGPPGASLDVVLGCATVVK